MSGGWSKQSGGDRNFFKFSTPGDTLMGKWKGTRPGTYGDNGAVLTKDGETQVFTLNTAIQELANLDQNTPVKIVYTGKQTSKAGNEFKAYDLFIWDPGKDGDDDVSSFSGPVEPAEDEDEVPF